MLSKKGLEVFCSVYIVYILYGVALARASQLLFVVVHFLVVMDGSILVDTRLFSGKPKDFINKYDPRGGDSDNGLSMPISSVINQ